MAPCGQILESGKSELPVRYLQGVRSLILCVEQDDCARFFLGPNDKASGTVDCELTGTVGGGDLENVGRLIWASLDRSLDFVDGAPYVKSRSGRVHLRVGEGAAVRGAACHLRPRELR